MNKESTRDRILQKGGDLVHAKGFNNTGIQEILDAAGVPKGSFYFYFKNKQDFGLQLVDHRVDMFGELVRSHLRDESLSPLARFRRLFNWFKQFYRDHGYSLGCPIGNLAQEMSDLCDTFRARLERAMTGLTTAFKTILDLAVEQGQLAPDTDTEDLAAFITMAWEGALLSMKLEKGPGPLDRFERMIFDKLLADRGAERQ